MKRTRAEVLALVNWKGVFYERYLLDRQVTALEGANGSGKTTVMIAAYIVLMPDLTRLRFANLGESSPTGGDRGIYGRLGDPDACSYAVIDFRLATGERLLAGVQVERRSEPNVELTPFVISGLADDVALQDILLDRGEVDAIPGLERVQELAARAGGRLRHFLNPADYFAVLFEGGVTPLRLTTDDERTKFNEMLRTSMIGGISRALTGGLRDFLLKRESGLADTLKQMRGNLDACRRTRLQVEEAQRMEGEIHDVYEAGQAMFVAAVHAVRERAEELQERLRRAQAAVEQGETEQARLLRILDDKTSRRAIAIADLTAMNERLESARQVETRTAGAHAIATRIVRAEGQRVPLASEAERCTAARGRTAARRAQARDAWLTAQEQVTNAARGLADFQAGLDELHRRASAYEQVSRRLAQVRGALPEETVGPENVAAVRDRSEQRLAALDATAVRLDREIATASQRRREYGDAMTALTAMVGWEPSGADALEVARDQLREARARVSLVGELSELPRRLAHAKQLAAQQQRVRALARRLSTPGQPVDCANDARAAFNAQDAALVTLRHELSSKQTARRDAERARELALGSVDELERMAAHWADVRSRADHLAHAWDHSLSERGDVEALARQLQAARDRRRDDNSALLELRQRALGLADQLERSGGQFSDALVHAAEAVDGELLAARYEDVAVEDAARLQAILGPLADAIIVDDVSHAARTLAASGERPDTVLLVDETLQVADADAMGAEDFGDSILIASEGSRRLTRIPSEPTLGRRARVARVRALRIEVESLDQKLSDVATELRHVDAAITAAAALLGDADLLTRVDPAPEIAAARTKAQDADAEARRLAAAALDLVPRIEAAESRRADLSTLLGEASLLDPPDHAEAATLVERRLGDAREARTWLDRCARHVATLEARLDVLRHPPPGDAEVAAMRAQLDAARDARDDLAHHVEDLRYVEVNHVALGWSDAPAALRARQGLRADLEAQLEQANADLDKARDDHGAAELAHDDAVDAAQKARAALEAIDATLSRNRQELAETGVVDASDAALEAAVQVRSDLQRQATDLDKLERKLGEEVVEAGVNHKNQVDKMSSLVRTRDEEEAQSRPMTERWNRFQEEADRAGVLRAALAPAIVEKTRSTGSVNLRTEAQGHGSRLVTQLEHAEGGKERAEAVASLLAQASQDFGISYLNAWLEAREWLRRRVPPQVAEVDDPLEMLGRVADHLRQLRERLAQNERNLRGRSEDVARNIETQRRKARQEVTRLNAELENVRFGSIHGVQIQIKPVENRERVLQALRSGEADQLLFHSPMPLEDAMAELFKNYGGGETGGQRLLDYREYMDLQVEVRRQTSREWERANPNRMSTGEAIGVGAAIMMVVLTAWERHANLLRARRAAGTLRMLFLDEANRLSQDNLAVLFELCENLDLQLLIAAPEVAQAQGNTTYRLVRQMNEHGDEVVQVTGRRTLGLAS